MLHPGGSGMKDASLSSLTHEDLSISASKNSWGAVIAWARRARWSSIFLHWPPSNFLPIFPQKSQGRRGKKISGATAKACFFGPLRHSRLDSKKLQMLLLCPSNSRVGSGLAEGAFLPLPYRAAWLTRLLPSALLSMLQKSIKMLSINSTRNLLPFNALRS